MKRLAAVCAALAVVAMCSVNAADKGAKKGNKAKVAKAKPACPVSGKGVKEASFVAYKGKKVFFCCDNCPAAFKKSPEKFAVKANHQLVVTRQFRQVKCPFSGGKVNKSTIVSISGVKVGFCCEKCQAKAVASKDLALIFADKPFDKGFKAAAKKGKKAGKGE